MDKLFLSIGARIREERKKSGLTQEDLADMAGISNNFVSFIETGQKVASIMTLKKIADALKIPMGALFSNIPYNNEKKGGCKINCVNPLFLHAAFRGTLSPNIIAN